MQATYLTSKPFVHVFGDLDQSLRLLELMFTDVYQLWGDRHLLIHDVTTPIFSTWVKGRQWGVKLTMLTQLNDDPLPTLHPPKQQWHGNKEHKLGTRVQVYIHTQSTYA